VRTVFSSVHPECRACGARLARTISTFAYHKSIETVHEESGGPNSPDYYRDPRNIGRSVEKSFQKMGMEVPAEIQEKIQAAREGEMPGPLKELQNASANTAYH